MIWTVVLSLIAQSVMSKFSVPLAMNLRQKPITPSPLWLHLRRRLMKISLFKDGHYADSVSVAFRELNHQVKQEYKRRKNAGLDGAELMHTAFSPKNPVFVLADQSTESDGTFSKVSWSFLPVQ
jgi:Protein of unknown function (Hypoth_ymh)